MKTRLLVTVVITMLISPLLAQTGSITGVVADTANNEKIPFATIAVYPVGSGIPVTGEISDGDGNFRISRLPYGDYRVVISFIGYMPDRKSVV